MPNSSSTSAAVSRTEISPTEDYDWCVKSPVYFQTQHFWTLPGPDDEETEPRLCLPWRGIVDLNRAIAQHGRVIGLKSRKIGFTTTGLSFALRLQTVQAFSRSHAFSYRDDAAKELKRRLKFAWSRLPDYLRLPRLEDNDHVLALDGSKQSGLQDDVRLFKVYPTTEDVSAEEVCDYALIDEGARMPMGRLTELMAAVEPTVKTYLLLISSGKGPTGDFADVWRAAKAGNVNLTPMFFPWWSREDRDAGWQERRLKDFAVKELGRREFPETEEDAFQGLEEYVFAGWSLDRTKDGAVGLRGPEPGHVYVHAWDIGRRRDAAVGVVLDQSAVPVQVVAYRRLERVPFPYQQAIISSLFAQYGGNLYIEENGPGLAVMENLDVPAEGFVTGVRTKSEIISGLKGGLESGGLKWSGIPQLDEEMRGYKWDDKDLVQDSVIALAIGYHHTGFGSLLV